MKCLHNKVYPTEVYSFGGNNLENKLTENFLVKSKSEGKLQERFSCENGVIVDGVSSQVEALEDINKTKEHCSVEQDLTAQSRPVTCWGGDMPAPLIEKHEKELLLKCNMLNADEMIDSDTETNDAKAKLISNKHEEEEIEMKNLSDKNDEPSFHSSLLVITDVENLLPEITPAYCETALSSEAVVEPNEIKRSESSRSCNNGEKNNVFYRQTPPGMADYTTDEAIHEFVECKGGIEKNSTVVDSSSQISSNSKRFSRTDSADPCDERAADNGAEVSSVSIPLDKDDAHLLNEADRDTTDETGEKDENEDASSEISVFEGSLGIDMLPDTWSSDVDRVIEIQLGAEEWGTAINAIEPTPVEEWWETTFLDIEGNKETEEDWNSSLREISESAELEHEWSTMIAENFENEEVPLDWNTTFNAIEKVDESENVWTTIFRKIKSHVSTKKEWITTLNSIGKSDSSDERWDFEMTSSLSNLAQKTDWSFKFNKIDETSYPDSWDANLTEMLLQCDDRATHWDTKFLAIAESNDEMDTWETTFRDLEPQEDSDPWSSRFNSISDEQDTIEDWGTKFLDIEKYDPLESDWLTAMYELNLYQEAEDWSTAFNTIINHENNALWDTAFNGILPRGDESEFWQDAFNKIETQDHGWETKFNLIFSDAEEFDWQVMVNPIQREGELPDD